VAGIITLAATEVTSFKVTVDETAATEVIPSPAPEYLAGVAEAVTYAGTKEEFRPLEADA